MDVFGSALRKIIHVGAHGFLNISLFRLFNFRRSHCPRQLEGTWCVYMKMIIFEFIGHITIIRVCKGMG